MAFSNLLVSMLTLLIMIVPGFIFKRKAMVNEDHIKSMSNILINLMVPCIIISSFQIEFSKELSMEVLKIGGLWAVMIAVSAVFVFAIVKTMKFTKIEQGILSAVIMIPNTGFVGIPVIEAFFGAEGLFYISICEIVSDIFVFSIVYQIMFRSVGVKGKRSVKEFLNPPMVAILIGYTLFLLDIRLPEFAGNAVSKIGSASTAIAMFVLGAQLEKLNFKSFIGKPKLYIGVFVRLVVMPAIAAALLLFGLGEKSFMATVFVLAWAMPAGIFSVIFSEKLGSDPSFAAENVMLSNVICLISIPVWTMILHL